MNSLKVMRAANRYSEPVGGSLAKLATPVKGVWAGGSCCYLRPCPNRVPEPRT